MTNRIEIFVGMVDRVGKPGSQAGAAAAVHDQFKTDQKGFSLIVQSTQTGAAVASVLSVTQMTAGSVPFINIATNTLAGTVTFLKIVAEYKSDAKLNHGDVISLVGNAAGVVASFALLAAAPGVAGFFTAVAIGATLFGVYNSELAKNIHDNAIVPIVNALKKHNITNEPAISLLAPDLTITDPNRIKSHFGGIIKVITWNPKTSAIVLDTKKLEILKTQANQQTVPFGGNTVPATAFLPLLKNRGTTITIGIESLNGRRLPGPIPSITTRVVSTQDNYACCTAPKQDKYH
ncbi:hypothetical protein [Pseudomonas sp. Teo4]|uniref:hypothetical protein n=1 Tax=Pseudomonas sp. Teo4 TaxID=3064528 RepID=UPI002ABA0EEC|nr:hypothetical protein [Pseudomonas sp. Teo4]MDZ3996247.1 hypothetical protein [Pseudomonas sp. Teo4]